MTSCVANDQDLHHEDGVAVNADHNEFACRQLETPCDANPTAPLALPAESAAKLIGVSVSHFYHLHRTGRLPLPIRLGRSVRWLRGELEQWLAAGAPSRAKWRAMKDGQRFRGGRS